MPVLPTLAFLFFSAQVPRSTLFSPLRRQTLTPAHLCSNGSSGVLAAGWGRMDAVFSTSTSATIWPRAAVAGGSFWGYHPDVTASSPEFNHTFSRLNARLASRGTATCPCITPSSRGCSQKSMCGVPYCEPPPTPPSCNNATAVAGYTCVAQFDAESSLAIGKPASISCGAHG